MPDIDECVDKLRAAKWLSIMDLQHGFWQMPLHEDSRKKIAFKCEFGTLVGTNYKY